MDGTAAILTNESRLVARAQAERDAFAALYDHYFPRVYNYVRYRVRDGQTADDITSQVFERALLNLNRYQAEKAPFGAWLFSIARNAIHDHHRRRSPWVSLEEAHDQPVSDPPPEELAARHETHDRLLAAVARLSDRERDLIALKFAAGMDNKGIAHLTGLSESNVGVILYRALRQLRSLMGNEE